MRLVEILLLILFLIACLIPRVTLTYPQALLSMPRQRAILAWHNGKEVLIYSAVVFPAEGLTKVKVLTLIPFPSRFNVTGLKLEFWERFQDIVSPYYSFVITPPIGSEIPPSALRTPIRHKMLKALEVSEPKELLNIVREELRGWTYYEARSKLIALISKYLSKGCRYWLIDLYEVPSEGGMVEPVKVIFNTPKLYYPFKALTVLAGGRTEVVNYVLTKIPLPYVPEGWSMACVRIKISPELDEDVFRLCGRRPLLSALHFNDLVSKLTDLNISLPTGKGILFFTGKRRYNLGETVKIFLVNLSNKTIVLPNTSPWEILSKDGKLIYIPIRELKKLKLASGDSKVWLWHQINMKGATVNPGNYIVKLKLANGTTLRYDFEIIKIKAKKVVVIPPLVP